MTYDAAAAPVSGQAFAKDLKLQTRPTFDSKVAMIEACGIALASAVVGTLLVGTLLSLLFMLVGLDRIFPGWLPFFIGFLASVVIVPATYYEIKRQAYTKSIYNFYGDYLEFREFGLMMNRSTGRIRYAEITDIFERSNPLQQMQGLKTIYLAVPGYGLPDKYGFTGVRIRDVRIGGGTGRQLVALIESYKQGEMTTAPIPASAPASSFTNIATADEAGRTDSKTGLPLGF